MTYDELLKALMKEISEMSGQLLAALAGVKDLQERVSRLEENEREGGEENHDT